MRRGPGVPLLALVLIVTAGLGVVLSERAVEPPGLWLEAPRFVPTGESFEVFVSADRPVAFDLRYGSLRLEQVAEVLRVDVSAQAGDHLLTVTARDARGATANASIEVVSRYPAQVVLRAPAEVTVGDPLTIVIEPARPSSGWMLAIDDVHLSLDDAPLATEPTAEGWVALTAIPLAAPPGERRLEVVVRDERGGSTTVSAPLVVAPNPRPIQELRLASEVLAVSTPEARSQEEAAWTAAFAAAEAAGARWREPFLLPVEGGRLTSEFGIPRRYAAGGRVSHHLGTDIAAPEGTPIVATNDGVVQIAGFFPIKGGWVVIDHGAGVTSHYFHQSRLAVAVGDVVERGAVIGSVGTTGLSSGPHLHWEMQIDGVPTHPMRWVGGLYPMVP
jgi:murein DD-endopeptidase MepM/ murein hydrolase activator NlpD